MQNTIFPHIKNIIFDLGGVILNIDYQLSAKAFKELGLKEFDSKYSQAAQHNLFDRLETGKITPEDFRKEIRGFFQNPVSDDDIDRAWDAMLLDLPRERLVLLEKLSKKYRLFLLSNTNAIHCKAYSAYMKQERMENFGGVFEKQYLSFEIGMRKPDREIFEFVLHENKLAAAETLFIDDSLQHIEGAAKAGINAYHLQPGQKITDLFQAASE